MIVPPPFEPEGPGPGPPLPPPPPPEADGLPLRVVGRGPPPERVDPPPAPVEDCPIPPLGVEIDPNAPPEVDDAPNSPLAVDEFPNGTLAVDAPSPPLAVEEFANMPADVDNVGRPTPDVEEPPRPGVWRVPCADVVPATAPEALLPEAREDVLAPIEEDDDDESTTALTLNALSTLNSWRKSKALCTTVPSKMAWPLSRDLLEPEGLGHGICEYRVGLVGAGSSPQ